MIGAPKGPGLEHRREIRSVRKRRDRPRLEARQIETRKVEGLSELVDGALLVRVGLGDVLRRPQHRLPYRKSWNGVDFTGDRDAGPGRLAQRAVGREANDLCRLEDRDSLVQLLEVHCRRVTARLGDVLVRDVIGGRGRLQTEDIADALYVSQRPSNVVLAHRRCGLRDDERRVARRRVHGGDGHPLLAGKTIGDVGGNALQLRLTRRRCPGSAEVAPIDLAAHRESAVRSAPSTREPTADPDAPCLSGPASCAVGVERTATSL